MHIIIQFLFFYEYVVNRVVFKCCLCGILCFRPLVCCHAYSRSRQIRIGTLPQLHLNCAGFETSQFKSLGYVNHCTDPPCDPLELHKKEFQPTS